ncbi:alpha/beta-hydrolase [Cucurbitaria berberidis CBS 394.84]|uniref:Alpha/beta-hydrolase n=1 Tax=Cucurbitaria berberidis CBS 394.84 TaxID=1168544 RepID=A0A9P4G7S4_9PLEO|nr:alpha/beta-hydrolase [Cucurbitaria berberidis CBS 394.84]KAF1840613.1 alpha/beta-hydrolase [Cucurbitaria berberidis CBS 394.84]
MATVTTTAAVNHRIDQQYAQEGDKSKSKTQAAIEFAQQAERLGQYTPTQESDATGSTQAIEAHFVTAQDAVIQTADGGRLPAVPIEEATKLNELRDILDDRDPSQKEPVEANIREAKDGTIHGLLPKEDEQNGEGKSDAPLTDTKAPWKTNPLFPPLPMYGPPTLGRRVHCWMFRVSSGILSFLFLLVIILGAAFTSLPGMVEHLWLRLTFRNPEKRRPFYEEENRRKRARRLEERAWKKQRATQSDGKLEVDEEGEQAEEFLPLEGGPDPLKCDVRYYARRVGLDCEIFDVQTEDGFIIELWHLYNPREYKRTKDNQREPHSPEIFPDNSSSDGVAGSQHATGEKKYPVLMIHGLLQSAGAYCTNDDDSLAFFLAKSGYDVWLGNNRCGFNPRHIMLQYGDPRLWVWNIRQMGVLDLPALISRVLSETGFEKLGLIAHSQGTTQSLVALAKEQRPEIGDKISVFCALAPAAYAGRLIGKAQFKFMQVISPAMFRTVFGIHAFIPFMMMMHSLLPGGFYGSMGYRVFAFLFNWTDERWERDLRDRMFQFAPVYVSAESMRWWLGRECFAKQKCILATREEKTMEDKEDEEEDYKATRSQSEEESDDDEDEREKSRDTLPGLNTLDRNKHGLQTTDSNRARFAWYGPHTPPFAFWVCGADDLVDGRRLLRRFERNREPFVDVVHSKIIEGYEHLDVIWAMDAIEKVGKEVREVLWRTAPDEARKVCRTPRGCEDINEFYQRRGEKRESATREVDVTAGEWSEKGKEQVEGGAGEGDRDLEKEMKETQRNVLEE